LSFNLSGFLLFTLWLCGCEIDSKSQEHTLTDLSGNALGSTWCVKVLTKKKFNQQELKENITQKLEETEKIFSHWHPDSELYKFNATKNTLPLPVHPDLYKLLQHAEWIYQESGGAFDPTVGTLVNLWGFGPTGKTRSTIPTKTQIAKAKNLTGLHHLQILADGRIRKKNPFLQLDLSGSAKGEIIDQVCKVLDRWNFQNYLVEIGGEVRALGKGRNGKGWVIGLENGNMQNDTLDSVSLRNYAVATSGNYRLNKPDPTSSGKASHLINPLSGQPVNHGLIAVNVFAPTARDADAWATALMILRPKEGRRKAEELDMVVRFCSKLNGQIKISYSSAYQRLYSTNSP
jgi:thiamine biosynthesis lipoprotein